MKLSPLTQIELAAALATVYVLLGCESPPTNAVEQTPPVYPAPAAAPVLSPVPVAAPAPPLVTVANVAPPPAAPPVVEGPVTAAPVMTDLTTSAPAPGQPGPGPVTPSTVALSPPLQEVVKLAESGVGDEVILAYIQNSQIPFNPTPEEILYLTDLGLSDVVVTALVNHRGAAQASAAQPPTQFQAPVNPGQPMQALPPAQVPVPLETTYNPEPPVVYGEPPPVEYVAPAPAVDYEYFYSSLAPYGSWVDVADYGWCWQPTVAVIQTDWRPYWHHGRWLNADCGWYWQSDYSWGWAPFHYGRWFHHPARGWCWRPDSVWAPAWVSWRYTDAYCGWAPLPPGAHFRSGVGFTYYGAHVGVGFGFGLHRDAWTFVHRDHFNDRDIWLHRAPPTEHTRLYRESRVANNYAFEKNVIVNRGVSDRVPGLARSEPRKIQIRDLPERSGMRPDHISQVGSDLVVYRPKPPTQRAQNPRVGESAGGRTVRSQPASLVPGTSSAASSRSEMIRPGPQPANERTAASRPGSVVQPQSANPAARGPMTPATQVRTEPARPAAVPRLSSETSNASAPASVASRPAVRPEPAPAARAPERTPASVTPAPRTYSPPAATTPAPIVQPAAPATVRSRAVQEAFRAPNPVTPSAASRLEMARPAGNTPGASFTPRAQAADPPPNRTPTMSAPVESRPATSGYQATVPARPTQSFTPTPAQNPPRSWSQPASQPRSIQPYSAPPAQSRPSYAPSPAQSRPSYAPYQGQSQPSYSAPPAQYRPAPSYSAPAVQSRPAPSYSAPAVQSRPAPSYSPPPAQSRPAPSYSAPAVQSRPASSYSAPASRPAPSNSNSGNRRQF